MHTCYRHIQFSTLIFFVIFFSCTHSKQDLAQHSEIKVDFRGIPEELVNGGIYKGHVDIDPKPEIFKIFFKNVQLSSWKSEENSGFDFLLSIDLNYLPNAQEILNFNIIYTDQSDFSGLKSIVIKQTSRGVEKLSVDPDKVVYSPETIERLAKEKIIITEILSKKLNLSLWATGFICPTKTCSVTSNFGIDRVFNDIPKGFHSGTDLRASVGTSLYAVSDARVAYTGNCFLYGNMIILDHGYGIFSIYGHLSKVLVEQGQVVEKGSKIALAGKTGRATGSHLHWSVIVSGAYVDPMMFLKLDLASKSVMQSSI